MNEDVLVLGSGHSIMLGHLPSTIALSSFSDNCFKPKNPSSINSFGLFGSDLNYNTYYPQVKPEEFKPSDSEFIEPVFRMLSSAIVSKGWYPVDFSQGTVLKDSMNLLVGQTVNCDHSTDIGNAIGSVKEVYWQESYVDNGITIPAGINAVLKIDGKANPRIARGIMMDPPSVHSNSVTVRFTWEKSHPDMTDEEFYDLIGSYAKDGRLVCKVANKILSYHETSLVSHGADPFAQKLNKDGKIVNPTYANARYSFADQSANGRGLSYTFADFKNLGQTEVIHNTMVFNNELITNGPGDHKPKDMNKELQEFIASLFGEGMLSLGEGKQPTQEEAMSLIKGMVTSNATLSDRVTSLEGDVKSLTENKTTLEEQVKQLTAEVNEKTSMAAIGTAHLEEVRTKVTADYKKLIGQDKVDENMISLISKANMETLVSLGTSYTTQLEEKFPLVCSKCGSKEVTRGSAQVSHEEEQSNSSRTTADVIAALRKKQK